MIPLNHVDGTMVKWVWILPDSPVANWRQGAYWKKHVQTGALIGYRTLIQIITVSYNSQICIKTKLIVYKVNTVSKSKIRPTCTVYVMCSSTLQLQQFYWHIFCSFVCLFLKQITSKVRTMNIQYLHQFHLDILWQSGRLHHICSRSHHLQQEQNDRRTNDTQQVIKVKLPLSMSNQSCAVQYGEIGMWSDVGFNICWTINSPNSTHIFPCGRLGDFGAAKSWKDKLQYLHHHHHLGLDILWQNGQLHHICGRSCHLEQEQNDRRMNTSESDPHSYEVT